MSKKQTNRIFFKSETFHKTLLNKVDFIKPVISERSKRWVAIMAIHLFFGLLIWGSVESEYLLFNEIMASTFIVFTLLFFVEEEQKT